MLRRGTDWYCANSTFPYALKVPLADPKLSKFFINNRQNHMRLKIKVTYIEWTWLFIYTFFLYVNFSFNIIKTKFMLGAINSFYYSETNLSRTKMYSLAVEILRHCHHLVVYFTSFTCSPGGKDCLILSAFSLSCTTRV